MGKNKINQFFAVVSLFKHIAYDVNVTRIPAISITAEDADLFQRFSDRNGK